jgi:hypothetical protein
MPEFLAETYAPRGDGGIPAPSAADIALAAAHASGPQGTVRFLGAIAVPEEETCFWLYQAPSAAAVRAAMTAAGLRPERITPAAPIRPPASAADPAGTSRRPPHPDSVSTRPRPP